MSLKLNPTYTYDGDNSVSSECSSIESEHTAEISGSDADATKNRDDELAQKETRAVFRLRVLVILALLVAAAAVSVIVYCITSRAETNEFETQFEGAASKILETYDNIVREKLAALIALGTALTAHSIDHNKTWPFVTVSSFSFRSGTVRAQSKAFQVGVNPIVTEENRREWEAYVAAEYADWTLEGYRYQEGFGYGSYGFGFDPPDRISVDEPPANGNVSGSSSASRLPAGFVSPNISSIYMEAAGPSFPTLDYGLGPYLPSWQISPVLWPSMVNLDRSRMEPYSTISLRLQEALVGDFLLGKPGDSSSSDQQTAYIAMLLSAQASKSIRYEGDPISTVYIPVFDNFAVNRTAVAVLTAAFSWSSFFSRVLPQHLNGVIIVLDNSCNGAYTYEVDGEVVTPIGVGNLRDHKFDYVKRTSQLRAVGNIPDGSVQGLAISSEGCQYSISVCASQTFKDNFTSNTPIMITFAVAIIFVFTALMFFVYDRLVERRQRLVLTQALQTTAIVSSLFPKSVRDRVMQANQKESEEAELLGPKHRLKTYLNSHESSPSQFDDDIPIADLFPDCTVMFADIAGFTAWSSTRDPAQVFILLQSVYQAFDSIAKRRHVFKVETIGDSYIAATGLPEPQVNHAVIMARFAAKCNDKMGKITRELEGRLGPDTGDLAMRFGLNSGPVTAGVLRGERARFQLFGDTVNTAARMESTGLRDKIQVSQTTADLLIAAGKSHWLTKRLDEIEAKGKGKMVTYWLQPLAKGVTVASALGKDAEALHSSFHDRADVDETVPYVNSEQVLKQARLVDWVAELMQEHIKKIVAMRGSKPPRTDFDAGIEADSVMFRSNGQTSLDELAEAIHLPKFDACAAANAGEFASTVLNPTVVQQLHKLCSTIASKYVETNAFHNFEHACHVTMAVNKFLKRIVAPDLAPSAIASTGIRLSLHGTDDLASQIHAHTHGIYSDPLTLFAIVFSALIHDIDHRGVSNVQLAVEQPQLAERYGNQSIAEQNSLDIAWDLLMLNEFGELRRCLFATKEDLLRFRQVVVSVVLATDIFDKELNDLRKTRWHKAFDGTDSSHLRATIVIEHIIQASDVSHTMQHWHVYRKWNELLFKEMYAAFSAGRMAKDPSAFWYKGELGFFDNYILPLAKKLKECQVFGVSSDECLNYAIKNRMEWEQRGEQVVAEMLQAVGASNDFT